MSSPAFRHELESVPVAGTLALSRVMVLEGTGRIGGGQRATLDMVEWLRGEYSFEAVVPDDGPLAEALAEAGVLAIEMKYPAPTGKFGLSDRLTYLPKGLASLRSLTSLVRQTRPSLLYATSRTALWAAVVGRITGTPVLVHLHMVPPTGLTAWYLRRVCSISSVKTVVVATPVIAGRIGLPPEKVKVCPNGIDTSVFKPRPGLRSEMRAQFGIERDAHVAAVIGELSSEKGQEDAIRAMHRLKGGDSHLLLVGEARESATNHKTELVSLAQDLGLSDRIHFTGHRHDINRLLSAVDLLIVPSRGPSGEACPMVVLEAWATGVPVLGANSGGLPDMLEEGNGLIFDAGSHKSLAAEWQRLIEDPQQLRSLARAGADAIATTYSRQSAAGRFRSAIERAISAA